MTVEHLLAQRHVRVRALSTLAFLLPLAAGRVVAATISVASGGDLQAAISSAQPGDTIALAPGATYTGNFTLPVKGGSSYITIETAPAGLPGDGARISPASSGGLAKLRSPNSSPALQTAPGAHHWRIALLEFQANSGGAGDIITLGDGSSAQNSLAQVPHDLVVDRCYIHGDPAAGQKRGIALNSGSTTITGSHISDIKASGQDSQAIGGWNGPGPYTITNNYLEAAGENVMFGGADPAIANLVPSDITISGNSISKPTAWRSQGWQVKNLLELKNARRVLIQNNTIEYNWQAAQSGFAILFTVRNQDGGCPWCQVANVTFQNNTVRHSAGGVSILGYDNDHPSQQTQAILIRNNVFSDIDNQNWGGNGYFLLMTGGPRNVTVDHNTIVQEHAYGLIQMDGGPILQFTYTNNLARQNSYGIIGSDRGPGNDSISAYLPGSVIAPNVFADADASRYPAGNAFPTSDQFRAQFVSYAGGDYRLVPTSSWRGAGSDGADLGASLGSAPGTGPTPPGGPTTPAIPPPPPAPVLAIVAPSLPDATVGVPYTFAFAATNGKTPYSWAVVGDAPAGLALSAAGVLGGAPQAAGAFSFLVQVADASAATAREQVQLLVKLAPLTMTTTTLPVAYDGVSYAAQIQAAGGQPAYRWTLGPGAPDWLKIDPATGALSGVPRSQSASGATPDPSWHPGALDAWRVIFPVTVSDSAGNSTTQTFTIVVETRTPMPVG